ncbi:MAG TPA: bifunctional methionine sulfoxide reductase B/A protein [Bacteroidales bacterium]|nr:bifunctional methionine sulfoxide reductase B/A protein [Bacteroidales bacterium]HPF03682.1 bifunctional methionine sulfoxide reductase B/A protein [Bacteroidales bacterium]HPJ60732.1 bifunctional methionine sulfoxide reductase B/A protein [Bacteroidales bacterium]HPR13144.1 bifunctional methionine sulfoxide reductase B/A protein [Bacteroidales bacterium]HRW85048.1 bifunctional methionine sulfoxide reductase B/A protein [Bacteroidales bacterium]
MGSLSFSQEKLPYNDLSAEESSVIIAKGTEKPFTGKFNEHKEKGTYLCKKCGSALFYSDFKFDSGCGWPSFDDEIEGTVTRFPDPDGRRTEITCSTCGAHLGHVFEGERLTPNNLRHCVNSVSLDFVPAKLEPGRYGTAIFAGGCFWGVEYFLQKQPGVITVTSGYIGGHVKNPTYKQVCTGTTGHAEAVKIIYDPEKTDYETLLILFLEIHDPTQVGGQGPDIGHQYRSEIFWLNNEQKKTAQKNLDILRTKGYKIATALTRATEFFDAEGYHQDYYFNNGKIPYCHGYTKRF